MKIEEQNFGPVRFIPGNNKGRYPFCHTLYLEGAGVIIDPASDREKLKNIQKTYGVSMVWLSHFHEDHLMHLDLFDDLPLWMHEKDSPPLSDFDIFADWYGHERGKLDHLRERWHPVIEKEFHFRPRKPARFLKGGETLELENITVDVIHAPGHSPGSLCFYFRDPELLFLGDYDLTPFGPFYGDIYSDIDQTIESINRLRNISAKTWVTSHDQGIFETNPDGLWDRYLGTIEKRENRIVEFLTQPRTIEEITNAWLIYGKPGKAFHEDDFRLLEALSIQKHLKRILVENNRYCIIE